MHRCLLGAGCRISTDIGCISAVSRPQTDSLSDEEGDEGEPCEEEAPRLRGMNAAPPEPEGSEESGDEDEDIPDDGQMDGYPASMVDEDEDDLMGEE